MTLPGDRRYAPDIPADIVEQIEDHRRRLATPGMTAGQFAELLPERLRQPYWRSRIDEYFATQEDLDDE